MLVRNSGVLGCVHKDYTVSLTEVLKNKYPDLEIDKITVKKVVYSNTTLNFGKNSNTDSEVIKKLERYESLRVLNEIGDWYLVMINEYEFGYVHKDYTKDLVGADYRLYV